MVFFPEGTRRNEEVLGKFHRGAFKVSAAGAMGFDSASLSAWLLLLPLDLYVSFALMALLQVAKDTNVEVVPITVNGARQLLSPFGLPELHQGRCSITIHKPIASEVRVSQERLIPSLSLTLLRGATQGLTEDELNEKTRQVILQELIAHPPNNMDEAKRD